jgi:hypothetical protein
MKFARFLLGGLILLGISVILFIFAVKPVQNISSEFFPSLTPTCVPTRSSSSSAAVQPTATPKPSEYGTMPPSRPSVTPIPFSKITDLSPDSPDDYKAQFIVFHCDGTYELFLSAGTDIPLEPGDHILVDFPPAILMEGQMTALANIWTESVLSRPPTETLTPTVSPVP